MTDEELEQVRIWLASLDHAWTPHDVAAALHEVGVVVSDATVLLTVDALRKNSVGAGLLEPLLKTPNVTDILVDGPSRVLIDRGQGLELSDVKFANDQQVRKLAVRLAASVGRRLDDSAPYVDARLASGVRFHAVLAPIADPGTCISLRVPAKGGMSLDDWVSSGSINEQTADLLRAIIDAKLSFLISGGTGSGKTTLLASMLAQVPKNQRLLIVEDSRELAPQHPQVVRLESRPDNSEGAGKVTLADLVRQALRMRPDRVIVGEIRGAELTDLLRALNTGHEGGCGTVHANSVMDVPARLEALAALGGLSRQACHSQIAAALQLVLHIRRLTNGKRLISEIGVFQAKSDGLVEVGLALAADSDGQLRPERYFNQLQTILGRS